MGDKTRASHMYVMTHVQNVTQSGKTGLSPILKYQEMTVLSIYCVVANGSSCV